MKHLLSILLASLAIYAQAQAPASRIYAFAVSETDHRYALRDPILLTGYNPQAYNNHPSFVDDSTLFVVSTMPGADQPDVFALDLKNRTRRRVTSSRAGEYSPQIMPDYYHFSAVRMEFEAGDTLLRLWKFPLNGSSSGQPLLSEVENVGYYHWLSSTDLAVFLVGDTVHLGLTQLFNERVDTIAARVGRCFRTDAEGRLHYVRKVHPRRWEIMAWDPASGRSRFVTETLPQAEDFVIHPNGDLLMGAQSKLYAFTPGKDRDWRELADLGQLGIHHITRLALHRKGILALVTEER